MKRTLVVAAILLFTGSLAWAGGPAAGGCMLPDLAGLSPEQVSVAALAAGFQVLPVSKAVQDCPHLIQCSGTSNCTVGSPCTIEEIGKCCNLGGSTFCCTGDAIKVLRCPCQCISGNCSTSCLNRTEVSLFCS